MKATRTVIEPTGKLSFRFKELWEYRELFYFFSWRDIKVKYKQTYLGILWALIQPIALMLLFTLVFSRHFTPDSGSLDYKLFVLSGLILWTLFYSATSHAAESVVLHANIIKKIYFPRLIIVGSALLTAFFDFLIALCLFFVVCLFMQQPISWTALLFFPAGIILALGASLGIGTLLAAFNVKFRDFRYALPFLLQFMFFSSQIVYSLADVRQYWVKMALSINPVNAAVELFRMGLGESGDMEVIGTGLLAAIIMMAAGLIYFRKTEAYFADLA